MRLPSTRQLEFVGITIQDGGHLVFDGHYGEESDMWHVMVRKPFVSYAMTICINTLSCL